MEEKCWFNSVCNLVQSNCEENCIRYLEFKFQLEHSNLPKSKWKPIDLYPEDCDLDAYHRLRDIKNNIVEEVEKGKNIYIGSKNTGNGKTSWAIKILLKYFSEVWAEGLTPRGLFIHVPTFLAQLKDFGTSNQQLEELKKLIPEVDLVVWDDVSAYSGYDLSQLSLFIEGRVISDKANIFTGNLLEEDFSKLMGGKLTSRIWNASEKIILNGFDLRGFKNGSESNNK